MKNKTIISALSILTIAITLFLASKVRFIMERLEAPYFTYGFMSGRCFNFDVGQIYEIKINSLKEYDPHWNVLSSNDEISEIVKFLNSFTCHYCLPEPDGESALPIGWYNIIHIYFKEPQADESSVTICFEYNRMLVNNIWYYGDRGYFDRLREFIYSYELNG